MRILLVLVLLGCFIATHAMPQFLTNGYNMGNKATEGNFMSEEKAEEFLYDILRGDDSFEYSDIDSDSNSDTDWTYDIDFDYSNEEYREDSSEDKDDSSGESSEEDLLSSADDIATILGALFKNALEHKWEKIKEKWGMKSWKHWGHKGHDWRSGREDGTDGRKHECPLKNKTEPILSFINETYHGMLNLSPPDSDDNSAERTKFVKSFLMTLKTMVFGHHGGHGPKPGHHYGPSGSKPSHHRHPEPLDYPEDARAAAFDDDEYEGQQYGIPDTAEDTLDESDPNDDEDEQEQEGNDNNDSWGRERFGRHGKHWRHNNRDDRHGGRRDHPTEHDESEEGGREGYGRRGHHRGPHRWGHHEGRHRGWGRRADRPPGGRGRARGPRPI